MAALVGAAIRALGRRRAVMPAVMLAALGMDIHLVGGSEVDPVVFVAVVLEPFLWRMLPLRCWSLQSSSGGNGNSVSAGRSARSDAGLIATTRCQPASNPLSRRFGVGL